MKPNKQTQMTLNGTIIDFDDVNFLDNLDIEIEKQNNFLSGNTSLNNTRFQDLFQQQTKDFTQKNFRNLKFREVNESRNSQSQSKFAFSEFDNQMKSNPSTAFATILNSPKYP